MFRGEMRLRVQDGIGGILIIGAIACLVFGCGGGAPAPGTGSGTPEVIVPTADQQAPPTETVPDAGAAPAAAGPFTGDALETLDGWNTGQDGPSSVSIASASGQAGNAMEITYNFNGGKWVDVARTLGSTDLAGAKGIRFAMKGDSHRNTLEVKFEDTAYSNFGKTYKTDNANWTTVEILFASMPYLWGENRTFDTQKANLLHFAISCSQQGDAGGAGKILIDEIEVIR